MEKFWNVLYESTLGANNKVQGKAISAYVVLLLIIFIVVSSVVFVIYALIRQTAISDNELAASHYLIEILIVLGSLKTALWGVSAWSNTLITKYQNPQPTTNVNVQTDKNIVTS